MTAEPVNYPAYRRLLNGKSWFRINSPVEMDEVKQMGSRFLLFRLEARTLPDRNHIYDITFGLGHYSEIITEQVFLEILSKVKEKES